MKSRLLLLITLLALVIPLTLQPMEIASNLSLAASSSTDARHSAVTSGSPQLASLPPVPSPDYSGVGAARLVKEVANRTDGGQSVTLFYNSTLSRPINGSTSAVLPPGWTGYKLGFSVTQLYENRCWVLNPSFNGNNNSWTTGYVDVRGYTNTFSQTWQSGGVDGNGYARVQENGYLTGGYYRYDLNDHVWERQIYTVNRSNVVWAGIRMDYRVDSAWGTNALFNVYIRINGTLVWVIGFQSVPNTNWQNTGFISIDPGLFTLPSKAIQVEVGINSTMTVGYSTNSWMRGEFDNIRLYTKTAVYPSEISLKMNGLTVPNQASRGSGVLTQVPATVWTSSPVIGRLNWSTIPRPPNPNLDVQVTGVCALNLFANKTGSSLYAMSPSATGVKYTTQSGQNTTWELYYQLALPSLYSNDAFNFTIPKDWNITFVSEPQLPSVNKVSQCQGGHVGDGYLKVPSTTITVSPDGYWYIRASSHNYVHSAELQVLQGVTWSTTTAVRAGNTTRVRAQILDGSGKVPVGVTSTQANVSIYNPDGTTLWYTQLVTPNSSGWVVSTNIIIQGSTTIGGIYTIGVLWSNSTEAGERQTTYSVTHATTLIARESTIYAFYENQPLYPKVRYNDTDARVWLSPPATVVGNWTTGTITFYWIAGTGYYEAEINALDVPDVGRYGIRVNATKSYYDGASCYIIIDISAETQVACPQSPALSVAWKDNATIQVHYMRKTDGAGVNGCIPYVEVTANWTTSFYIIVAEGNGWYTIRLNSTAKVLGTYALNITLTKERFQRQQFYLFVTVRARNTQFTYTPPTSTPYEENATVQVQCADLDASGAALLNTTGRLHLQVWNGSIQWPSGSHYFWIASLGGGTYSIYINTSYLPGVGNYPFEVRLQWVGQPYYANRTVSLIVTVRQFLTRIDYDAIPQIPWDENAIVTIYYLIDDSASTRRNGDPIAGGIISASLSGKPLVNGVNFTYTEIAAGKYRLTIYKAVLGSITSYILHVSVSYPSQVNPALNLYQSADRNLPFAVRELRTRLDYTPPESTPFGDDVKITLLYLVSDDESSRNGQGINDASASMIVQALGGWTLNPGDYTYATQGAGYYLLTIKASALASIRTYSINATIQEVSTGRYDSARISRLDFIVRTVYTALTLDPFDPAVWGANVTVVAHYRVSDAGSSQNNNPISGAPVGVVGVGWSLSHPNYTITEPAAGTYYIVINTSAVAWPGSWQINITIDWPSSPPTYQEHHYITALVVTTRTSSLTSSYVPSTDYGAVFNVTLTYYDVVGARNIANDTFGGHIRILAYNATDNSPLSLSVYTVTALPDDTYVVGIYTSTFGRVNVFHQFRFNATWAAGYLPFYANASEMATVYVVGTKTTVLYTPPEPEPYGDTLTFVISYNMTAAPYTPIDNTTGYVHITARCTTYPALSLRYVVQMLASGAKGYLLVINSSNFPTLGQYTFQVNVSWPTNIAPYYASQSVLMGAYVRAIHTSLTWTLPASLYWGDMLYLRVTYRDDDHGVAFSDPTNTSVTLWLSWGDWQVVQIFSNGTYQLRVNTTSRSIGLASFNIRFTRTFAETREQTIQFTINPLPLAIEVLSPSPWTAKFAESVVVTVRVTDLYGRRINDSTTVYHWAGLPPASLTFVGNGVYNVTFGASQGVGTYLVTIEASKTNCQTGLTTMTLYIIPVDTSLVLLTSSVDAVVGETFRISARFTTVGGAPLPGASLRYSWAGGNGSLVYVGGGVFNVTLGSSGLALGRYSIYVTASDVNVVEKLGIITVTLTVIPASIQTPASVLNVNWTQSIVVLVYFNDTYHNLPISGATINYRWGPLSGSLNATSTPGWYNGTLPTTVYSIGVFDLTLTVDHEGYQFATAIITVNIVPQPTQLALQQVQVYYALGGVTLNLTGTTWRVPTGDTLRLYFNFTDSRGQPITDGTARYYWELGEGLLQFTNGFYVAVIDLTGTTPALHSLRVYFQRQNYATSQMTGLTLNVVLVDTLIRCDESVSVYTGSVFSVQVTYWDTYHNLPIVGADVTLAIPGLGWAPRAMRDNQDGTYTLDGISISAEGSFNMIVNAVGEDRYAQAQRVVPLVVTLNPVVRNAINIGAVAALIGLVALAGWLAYAKVYSIPWLVRKMRGMSKTLGKGKTPSLSGHEIRRISTRPAQMTEIVEPVYGSVGLAVPSAVIPLAVAVEERGAEDDTIWRDLEQLEGLGQDQKLELFEEMKRIPPKDRVWFLEDLKRQLEEGKRLGKPRPRPAEKRPVPPGIDPGVMARLDAISALSSEEKQAMIRQLRGLSKAEQEEAVRALEEAQR